MELLEGMYDLYAILQTGQEQSNPAEMNALCEKYAGFYRFAKLLEDLDRGIQDGTIDVPR